MSERRFGKFSINKSTIEDNPCLLKELLKDVIIVRAEMSYADHTIDYVGLSDFFPIHEIGMEIPQVSIICTRDEDGIESCKFELEGEA